jgi:SAM-dependent methyltransferase
MGTELDRVRAMLDPTRVSGETSDAEGYLDLLGADFERPRTRAQDAMHSPLVASIYERWWRPVGAMLLMGPSGPRMGGERKLAREALELDKARTVLDVCCGPGNFTRSFPESMPADGLAIGLDVSPPMLAHAVRDNSADRVAYVRGDARNLPFPDSSFDAVSCFAALYLVPEPYKVLDELVRVLAPGGRIAVLTSCLTDRIGLRELENLLARVSGQRMFRRDEITELFADTALTNISQQIRGAAQFITAHKPPTSKYSTIWDISPVPNSRLFAGVTTLGIWFPSPHPAAHRIPPTRPGSVPQ